MMINCCIQIPKIAYRPEEIFLILNFKFLRNQGGLQNKLFIDSDLLSYFFKNFLVLFLPARARLARVYYLKACCRTRKFTSLFKVIRSTDHRPEAGH